MKNKITALSITVLMLGMSFRLNAQSTIITTVVGDHNLNGAHVDGPALSAGLTGPLGINYVHRPSGDFLYIADSGGQSIRVVSSISSPNSSVSTFNPPPSFGGFVSPFGVALDANDYLFVADGDWGVVVEFQPGQDPVYLGNDPGLSIALDSANYPYVIDEFGNTVSRLDPNTGQATIIAGNGQAGYSGNGLATTVKLNVDAWSSPSGHSFATSGLTVDKQTGDVYIADFGNHIVRKLSGGYLTTVAGTPGQAGFFGDNGPAVNAKLSSPAAVALDGSGNLYIADSGNHVIRRVAANGVITTVAGIPQQAGYVGDNVSATSAKLNSPAGLALDLFGDLYIADTGNDVIRKLSFDSDGDGLPDSWEMQYFGNLGHDGSLDSDGDHSTDAEEYAAGTNPTTPDNFFPGCVGPFSGVKAFWRAEVNANDTAGVNNGIVHNATYASARGGTVFKFDGDGDYIEVPNHPSLMLLNQFTVEGWVNYHATTDAGGACIIAKGQDAPTDGDWAMVISAQHQLRPHAKINGSWLYFDCGPVLVPDRWYHLAMTYDGSSLKGYVNGVLVGSRPASGLVRVSTNPVKIGAYAPLNGSIYKSFFNGMIDELAVYDRPLDYGELLTIYNASYSGKFTDGDDLPDGWEMEFMQSLNSTGADDNDGDGLTNLQEYQNGTNPLQPEEPLCIPAPSNIKAWWRAEGNANDSISANNGTFFNGTFAAGRRHQGFSFNGTSAYVQIPHSPDLAFTTSFTVEAWINYVDTTDSGGGCIVAKGIDANSSVDWAMTVSTNRRLRPHAKIGGQWCYFDCGPVLIPGRWYHVAMTYDGYDFRGYVNGDSGPNDHWPATFANTPVQSSNSPLKIGAYAPVNGGPTKAFFKGRIDEVAVYNRALSGSEIVGLYNSAAGGRCVPGTVTVSSMIDSTASENGHNPGTFRITRTTDNLAVPVTVNFQMSGTAVNGIDYILSDSQATIPPLYTYVDIVLTPLSDFVTEGNETATMTLTGCDNGYIVDTPTASATVTITDGAPPVHEVTVQPADSLACEASGDQATFAVWRTGGDFAAPLTVTYTLGGTAQESSDYASLSPHSVTFPANQSFAMVSVQPLADATPDENPETVTLTLLSGAHYTVGDPNTATVNILESCAGTDSTGKNFWILFPKTVEVGTIDLSLIITAPTAANGSVEIPGLGFQKSFSVVPGKVTTMPIPLPAMPMSFGVLQNLGIHITADQPVSVSGFNSQPFACEAYLAYPVGMLGANYCLMARPSDVQEPQLATYQAKSEFAIVATENLTKVTITPSPKAHLEGHSGTIPFDVWLDQGQTYQLRSIGAFDDVTGTFVTSDRPIAVFAGVSAGRVPDFQYHAANLLMEQQLPVSAWGRQALGVPIAGRMKGDVYRVLTASSNTWVRINSKTVKVLQPGQFYEAVIDGPVQFDSNNPIQVAQFATGDLFGGAPGDPFEILLPPTGHYQDSYTVLCATNFPTNYLNMVVERGAVEGTFVDGKRVPAASFKPIASSGYVGVQYQVDPGAHTVSSPKPLGLSVYGLAEFDGYGYIGGVANFPLVAVPDAVNVSFNTATTFDVLTNDIFANRANVTLTLMNQPAHGGVTVAPDKRLVYAPDGVFRGSVEFTYKIEEQGYQATTTVTLMIDPCTAVDDYATVCPSGMLVIPVLDNDSSPADLVGGPSSLTIVSVAGAVNGTPVISNDRKTIIYTVGSNPDGDTLVYTITDSRGSTATAMVFIDRLNPQPDTVNVAEGQTVVIPVLENDGGGRVLSITTPIVGTAAVVNDGSAVSYYLPPGTGAAGPDYFGYTVQKGDCTSSSSISVYFNLIPVSITTQPQDQIALVGSDVSLTVVAAGSGPLYYEWFNEDGVSLLPVYGQGAMLTGGGYITGANTDTLTLQGLQIVDSERTYYVKVYNVLGSVYSAKVTVYVGPNPPVIRTQPVSQDAVVGQSVQFSVVAISLGSPTYQWYKDEEPMDGKTLPTLTLSSVQLADAANYSVIITDENGGTTSRTAVLHVYSDPSIFMPPKNQAVPLGESVTFEVEAVGVTALTYQWFHDGTPVGTGPVLTINNVQATHAGSYWVQVSDVANSVISLHATLNVLQVLPPTHATADLYQMSVSGPATTFNVLINDTDSDHYSLTITQPATTATPTPHGTVHRSADSLSLIYTPTPGFQGVDVFNYTISNGHGRTAVGQVIVSVGDNTLDSDGDGMADAYEIAVFHTDPNNQDTDGNGVLDGDENPSGDGMDNWKKIQMGLDPFTPLDLADSGNGLPAWAKNQLWKNLGISNPDPRADSDGDGVDNATEAALGTDPSQPDDVYSYDVFAGMSDQSRSMTMLQTFRRSGTADFDGILGLCSSGRLDSFMNYEVWHDMDESGNPLPGYDTIFFGGCFLSSLDLSDFEKPYLPDVPGASIFKNIPMTELAHIKKIYKTVMHGKIDKARSAGFTIPELIAARNLNAEAITVCVRELQLWNELHLGSPGQLQHIEHTMEKLDDSLLRHREALMRLYAADGLTFKKAVGQLGKAVTVGYNIYQHTEALVEAATPFYRDVGRRCDRDDESAMDVGLKLNDLVNDVPIKAFGYIPPTVFWMIEWNFLSNFDGYGSDCE
jgi:hypothetical protein